MEETNISNNTNHPFETPSINPITPNSNNIYKYLLFFSLIIIFGVIISFYITKRNKSSQLSNNIINKPTPTKIIKKNNIESPTPTTINKQIEKLDDKKSGPNIFHLEDIKVGDKIGEMTIKSVSGVGISQPSTKDNYLITFTGPVTISGRYYQMGGEPGDMFPDRVGVCFEPDEESSKKMPQEIDDNRHIWFCLNNDDLADKELSMTDSGKATITIDSYKDVFKGMAIWNTATLIKVINKNKE